MGNDVFFFNDKTGRVERLHPQLERGDNYAGLMDSVLTRSAQCGRTFYLKGEGIQKIIVCRLLIFLVPLSVFSEAQQSCHWDPGWLRRPRSKYSSRSVLHF